MKDRITKTIVLSTKYEFIRVFTVSTLSGHNKSQIDIWHFPSPGKTYPICIKERDKVVAVRITNQLPLPFCRMCLKLMKEKSLLSFLELEKNQ